MTNLPTVESFDPVPKVKKEKYAGLNQLEMSRADVVRKLTSKIPLNQLGLPEYIYSSDIIDPSILSADFSNEERVDILEAASITLDYTEGYPIQPNGTSFWSRLSFEPIDAFNIFVNYLGIVREQDDEKRLIAPVRTYEAVAAYYGLEEAKLREYANLYYWPQRAKAYDLFIVASFQKQRETRALFIEDAHFRTASKWLEKTEARLSEIFDDEDEIAEMKPKEVFAMLQELMKLQRISAGLPANGGQGIQDGPKNASLEVALRTVAQKAGEEAREQSNSDEEMEAILQDPDSLKILQELVIKSNVR